MGTHMKPTPSSPFLYSGYGEEVIYVVVMGDRGGW